MDDNDSNGPGWVSTGPEPYHVLRLETAELVLQCLREKHREAFAAALSEVMTGEPGTAGGDRAMFRFWRNVTIPREDRGRKRWPTVPHLELWDIRVCQECGHLVYGGSGQRAAQHYHNDLLDAIEGPQEWEDPGGFILPDTMPPGMTGARPSDDEDGIQ